MTVGKYTTALGYVGAGMGGAALGGLVGFAAGRSSRRKKARKGARTRRSAPRKKYYPYTAGKRKDTSHRRIRFTKNGQPYIIMASGKARFIKRSSMKRSRKLSGGRY